MSIELFIVGVLRALVEVALLSLLGQGLVGLLAGASRQTNPVYRVFLIITNPPVKFTRWLTPKLIIDKHVPFITFFVLFWLWILLAYVKRVLCDMSGLVC
jgi:hypothetical protein